MKVLPGKGYGSKGTGAVAVCFLQGRVEKLWHRDNGVHGALDLSRGFRPGAALNRKERVIIQARGELVLQVVLSRSGPN